jgi:hypothetical protein
MDLTKEEIGTLLFLIGQANFSANDKDAVAKIQHLQIIAAKLQSKINEQAIA